MNARVRIIVGVALVAAIGASVWFWIARGRESTDDAQVDAHITPVAARVAGSVLRVSVEANQAVEAGAVLVEIDPRDYEVALEHARAELADAEAAAAAARANVPITSTAATSGETTAQGGVEEAEAAIVEARHALEAARVRHVTAQAHRREAEAKAEQARKDVERLEPLLAKDEIARQQFDAAVAASAVSAASVDSLSAQVQEAELDIQVAESRLARTEVRRTQAGAALEAAQTAPSQIAAARARAEAAEAQVRVKKAAVAQAELDLEHTTLEAPLAGVVRRSVEVGQVVQVGQPLLAIVPLDDVWITANFKETQLEDMRPGQRVRIRVDAYGGREFTGHVESLAPATGARFSLLPPDNATGNYVKVVQRVPVRISIDQGQDPDHLLRPGMSVAPTVYTR